MKRRWFLVGLGLSAIRAGCGVGDRSADKSESEEDAIKVTRNSQTLVVATSANYPPYEHLQTLGGEGSEESDAPKDAPRNEEGRTIVGFDIDVAQLIAQRLDRKLSVVDVEFGALIPALVNDEVDMAIAALEPNRSRKQKVDFSNIYYRSRQSLISYDGYLRARDLNYQTIGIRDGSVQARYTERIGSEYPDLDVIPYETIDELFEALDIGAVEGIILEANVAKMYLDDYLELEANVMPSDQPSGSAIAFPKNSSLRRDVNAALSDIKASGEMDELIEKWFS